MHLSSRVYRKSRVLVAATLVISALAASPALARKPVRSTSGSGKCWVVPNPVTNGDQVTVNGSGFQPGVGLDLFVGGGVLFAQADSFGNFSTWTWAQFSYPGTFGINVFQMGDQRMTILATCYFQVQ